MPVYEKDPAMTADASEDKSGSAAAQKEKAAADKEKESTEKEPSEKKEEAKTEAEA